MEARWGEVQILPYKKLRKSVTARNHSIHALSKLHQPTAKPLFQSLLAALLFYLNNASPAGNNLIPVLGLKTANDNHFHFV